MSYIAESVNSSLVDLMPLRFDDIYGHEDTIAKMESVIHSKGGTYLFFGPPSTGKRSVAFSLARLLLCNKDGSTGCTCPACSHTNNPDFLCVGRYERIKVADIERVLTFMSLKPLVSNRKIVVLDNADDITWEAANRLLKPLEEPPAGFFIFLVSSNPKAILPTLRGRCVSYEFHALRSEDIINVLFKKMSFELPQARTIGWLAAGMPVDIFSKAGQYLQCRDTVLEFLTGIRSKNVIACLDFVERLDKQDLPVICDVMVALVTDLSLLNSGLEQIINMDVRDTLKKMAQEYKARALVYVVDVFSQVKKNAYLNVNLNLALKSAFIKAFPYIKV